MPLTDQHIKNAAINPKAYKLSDSGGLYLDIRPNGSKYWRYKYRFHGKAKLLALGVYPTVRLAEARKKHLEARSALQNGIDPSAAKVHSKRQAKVNVENSFEAVARDWIKTRARQWKSLHVKKQTILLEQHVFPKLGGKPIANISVAEIREILNPLVERGVKETALRVNQTCGAVFKYAVTLEMADRNPCQYMASLLPKPPKKHNPYLEDSEIPDFITKLESHVCEPLTKYALKLALLTAARTSEIRKASWSEVNLETGIWRIPAERMKAGRLHSVPLPRQAIELLRQVKNITGNQPYIFASRAAALKPMSENTMLFALYDMGYQGKLTTHGIRGTFSTFMNKRGYNRDFIECQLAHQDANRIRGSYNHTDYFDQRAEMMQWWADYLERLGLNAKK